MYTLSRLVSVMSQVIIHEVNSCKHSITLMLDWKNVVEGTFMGGCFIRERLVKSRGPVTRSSYIIEMDICVKQETCLSIFVKVQSTRDLACRV